MTTATLPPPPVVEDDLQEAPLDLDAVCERIERRFEHVDDDEFMNLLKTWILEIVREKGL